MVSACKFDHFLCDARHETQGKYWSVHFTLTIFSINSILCSDHTDVTHMLAWQRKLLHDPTVVYIAGPIYKLRWSNLGTGDTMNVDLS